jgi:hypothetical protein
VTGTSQKIDNYHFYATIKYDTDGNDKWIATKETEYYGWVAAYDIIVDNQGNSYVTGHYQGQPTEYFGNDDMLTVKYDSEGNELWAIQYDPGPGGADEGRRIEVDNEGNIYIAAAGRFLQEDKDIITFKYSPCDACLIDENLTCDGEENLSNPCQICDITQTETGWSDNDGIPCDDGQFCTGTGTCSEGQCTDFSGDPCKPGETCDEKKDECVPAEDDDDSDDDDDDDNDAGDDDDGAFQLNGDDGNGCCGC